MQQIRGHLNGEVDDIIGNAQQLLSWKHYVRAYPWPSLLAAAAVGYAAIPRRLETVRPDPDTLAQLAQDKRLVVEHRPVAREKPSIAQSVVRMLGNTLLRAGVAYAGQQMGKMIGEQASEETKNETQHV